MKNGQRGGGSVFVNKYKCRTRHGVATAGTSHDAFAKVGFAGAHLAVQKHHVATPEQGSERLATGHGVGHRCADEIKRNLVFHAGYSTISRLALMWGG